MEGGGRCLGYSSERLQDGDQSVDEMFIHNATCELGHAHQLFCNSSEIKSKSCSVRSNWRLFVCFIGVTLCYIFCKETLSVRKALAKLKP